MCRPLVPLLVIALMTSGCSTRGTIQNQLWRDQHPVWSATFECSAFMLELVANAVLQSAALALCGR